MKVLLLLVAVLIASALAQGHLRPQLSNSFSAVVDFQERHGHTSRSFSGNWYMDDIGRQERFNAQSKRGLLDFFRFWNTSLAFEFQPKSGACTKNTVPGKYYSVFGWIHLAHENGACKQIGGTETGNAWKWGLHHEKLEMQLDLCVDETGKVPLWTEMKGVDNGTEFARGAVFKSYTAGTPSSTYFQLPASCNQS